ncbi:MAG TPA: phosphotransferase [Phycisphaerae bacterium]|nr:phosphotransferase [Phycisphaerae bacterium]
MIELSEQNAADYLRQSGRASDQEILVQSLSGGVANVVLKIFDMGAGEKVGTDLRSPAQKKLNKPDDRPNEGHCYVLKQPLPRFKTQAEWLVDIARVLVERDCMELLRTLLPANSVPDVLWFDEPNHILAISCAPTDSVIWKKALLSGQTSTDAAMHAGMLLAMMHSSTLHDLDAEKRYGDPKFFVQQRIDPYLHATAEKHPEVRDRIHSLGNTLLNGRQCLIHGDYSPKNIFLVPHTGDVAHEIQANPRTRHSFPLSHLLLLDFEVAFYGHCAFDVATLINHLLLKGFYHHKHWRPFMLMADGFWQTYRNTADPELTRSAGAIGGHVLGALMLARIDGKSPAEYLIPDTARQDQVRRAAKAILTAKDPSLDQALDIVSGHFDDPD